MTKRVSVLAICAVLGAVPVSVLAAAPGAARTAPPPGVDGAAVRFTNPEGVQLSGRWYPGPPRADAVVMAPRGPGGTDSLDAAAKQMQSRGFSVLTFDYRDFGPGRPAVPDSLRYVVLATRWVTDMVGALGFARGRVESGAHVFAWGGHDLPSRVALAAAARDSQLCDGVAIEGVQRSSEEIMRLDGTALIPEAVRQLARKVMMRDEPAAAAANLKVPVLLLAGGLDTLTSPGDTQRMFAGGRNRRDRMLFPQGGHTDLERSPDYFERLSAWLRRMANMLPRPAGP